MGRGRCLVGLALNVLFVLFVLRAMSMRSGLSVSTWSLALAGLLSFVIKRRRRRSLRIRRRDAQMKLVSSLNPRTTILSWRGIFPTPTTMASFQRRMFVFAQH
jgi:hypothetical protein